VAQTLAVDLGSSTAVLDPVEGLTEGTKTRTTYSYANKPRSPGRRERVHLPTRSWKCAMRPSRSASDQPSKCRVPESRVHGQPCGPMELEMVGRRRSR
jgi:hypothetical protein